MMVQARALQLACIEAHSELWQVRRSTCAEDVQKMGWDKLLRVVPPELKHSENMLAELFEVGVTQCVSMLMEGVIPYWNSSKC